jgi:hypothetical protein
MPQDLPELRRRIIAAFSETYRDLLQWVWAKMEYRLYFCHVTSLDTQSTSELCKKIERRKMFGEFLFPSVGRMLNSLRHSIVSILWNVSGNYE